MDWERDRLVLWGEQSGFNYNERACYGECCLYPNRNAHAHSKCNADTDPDGNAISYSYAESNGSSNGSNEHYGSRVQR